MKNQRDGHRRPASSKHGWGNLPVEGSHRYVSPRRRFWIGMAKGLTLGFIGGVVIFLIGRLFV